MHTLPTRCLVPDTGVCHVLDTPAGSTFDQAFPLTLTGARVHTHTRTPACFCLGHAQVLELKAAYTPSSPNYKFKYLFLNVVDNPAQVGARGARVHARCEWLGGTPTFQKRVNFKTALRLARPGVPASVSGQRAV